MRFLDRRDGGQALARLLSPYADRPDVVVLGLPRGGVPVADQVARSLHAPLDVFLVRKLGVPGHEELAFGAVAEGGVEVINRPLVAELQLSSDTIARVAARERTELERRAAIYRGARPAPDIAHRIAHRIAILIDDGLATGATMEAAVRALRTRSPARVVVAAPVGARETCARLRTIADEVICAATPAPFDAVGLWYADFAQTTDEEVRALLSNAGRT